jgi:Ser/Thr protein kinase RdoA (MazF antagonist)
LGDPDLPEFLGHARMFREAFTEHIAPDAGSLPTGIVHHDVNAGNVLITSRGDIAALLDFDEAHVAHLLTDLASLVHYWGAAAIGSDRYFTRVVCLLASYDRRRALVDAEWRLLPDFVLLFYLADAAEYIERCLKAEPAGRPVAACRSYRMYLKLLRDQESPAGIQSICDQARRIAA